MDNPTKLRELMQKHGLSRSAVAKLLTVSDITVDSWLAPVTSKAHRVMPDNMLRLAMLELGEARRARRPRKPAPLPPAP